MSLENMTEDERNSAALKRLFNHPEVGMEAKRLYKKVAPDAKFPDLDAEERRSAERAETAKQIEQLNEKLQMQEIQNRRKEHHQKIRDAGLDPDAVEKVMTDEKIGSYDTAVKFIKAQNANSAPTPGSMTGTALEMPPDWKEIAKNPKQWAHKQADIAINELKARRQGG